jgi:hypothetical protein
MSPLSTTLKSATIWPAAPPTFRSTRPAASRLSRLRGLVLLSGSVRANGWRSALGRSVLDLPLEPDRSLLAHWVRQAADLARVAGPGPLDVQVLVDRTNLAPEPGGVCAAAGAESLVRLRVERDPLEFRGTGGLLRDISLRYDEDDYLLVASGSQVLVDSLESAAFSLATRARDVALLAHDDGTPSGLMWIRCGCLKGVPDIGFVDMKEQALPQIARQHHVAVWTRPPLGLPVRTPAEYLAAVRLYHLRKHDDARLGDPFAEDWRSTFMLVEEGAEVEHSAKVHDSVVLRGGRVRRKAVVVRSLVAPGGVAHRGQYAVDQFLSPSSDA